MDSKVLCCIVAVFFLSYVFCEKCGYIQNCTEDQCCITTKVIFSEVQTCKSKGRKGASCGGDDECPCKAGLECTDSRCVAETGDSNSTATTSAPMKTTTDNNPIEEMIGGFSGFLG
nr:venom protein [Lampona murina]